MTLADTRSSSVNLVLGDDAGDEDAENRALLLRRARSDTDIGKVSSDKSGKSRRGLASFESDDFMKINVLQAKGAKDVHLDYVLHDNGEVRDLYGFEVSDVEKDNLSKLIVEASEGNEMCYTPPTTRKHIMDKELIRRKQDHIWNQLKMSTDDWKGLWRIPQPALERWHKSYQSEKEDLRKVNKYLLDSSLPSHPFGTGVDAIFDNDAKYARHVIIFSRKRRRMYNITTSIRQVGVPPKLRNKVWLICSGALRKKLEAGEHCSYAKTLNQASREPPELSNVIERDLYRTFPTNYHFKDEEGITRMRNVLLSYSLRNNSVGYCQSMNFLVAVLLLHMDEEAAFWVLSSIVEDLVPGHYTKTMTGMHLDQKVFEALVEQRLPKVHAHLAELDFPLESVTYQWFLCLFVNSLPLETTLRIWDCFLHEGCKALFRTGLAILMLLSKDILCTDNFMDLHQLLTDLTISGDKLLKLAYDPFWFGSFPSDRIASLRSRFLPIILEHEKAQIKWNENETVKTEPQNMSRRPSQSFKYALNRTRDRRYASVDSVDSEGVRLSLGPRRASTNSLPLNSSPIPLTTVSSDPGQLSESAISDLPQEYSKLYNTLSFIMTAKPLMQENKD